MPAPARPRAVLLTAAAAALLPSLFVATSAEAAGSDVLTYESSSAGSSGRATALEVRSTSTTLTFTGETAPGQATSRGLSVWFEHAPGSLPVGSYEWSAGDTTAAVRASTYYLGCLDPAGRVQVHESQLQADGSADVFAATYALTCPDGTAAAGEVRWRSSHDHAAVEALPAVMDAGRREVGRSSVHTVTIANRGTVPLQTGAPALSGQAPASWSVTSTTCGVLPVGGTCAVVVTARPEAVGTRSALLRVPVSTPGGSVVVALSTLGIVKPYAPYAVTVATGIGRAQVSWTEVASPDAPIEGYSVYRSVAGGPRTWVGSSAGTHWDDVTVQQGRTYVYSVEARNVLGLGPARTAPAVTIPARELVWGGRGRVLRQGGPGAPLLADGPDRMLGRSVDAPSLSPDGRSGAWWADVPGMPGLYVGSADGRGGRRVVASYAPIGPVSWSPDGRTLLYSRETGTQTWTLFSVPAAGGAERAVATGPDLWGPTVLDARTVVLLVHDAVGRGFVRLDLVTGARTRIPGSDGAFGRALLSPDGRTLAFTHLDGLTPDGQQVDRTSLRLLPVGGGTPRTVPTDRDLPTALLWTGDGRSLFVRHRTVVDRSVLSRIAEVPVDGRPAVDWGPLPLEVGGGLALRYADVTPPAVAVAGAARTAVVPAATTTWRGTDASGVVSYDVRTRRARYDGDHGPATVVPGLTATAVTRTTTAFAAGFDTCVDVRARDAAGRTSGWVERCTARPLDDRALTASRGWSRVAAAGTYAGTVSTARSAGATLSLGKVVLTRGHLVATRCPGCGSVEVRVGGRLLGTVSLAAPVTQRQVLVPLPGAGTTRTGPLVLRTTSSRPVHVDGVAVGRT